MESRSGNLHFVHNLFTFSDNLLHFVASCKRGRGEAICLSPGIILVFLDHFRMRTKVIRLHDDKYYPAPAHSLFALPMGNKMIFALTYNRKLWQQKNNERERERERA